MPRGNTRDTRAGKRLCGIEPVALGHVANPEHAERRGESKWRAPDGEGRSLGERANRVSVVMVVVVVRLEHEIDRRQRVERDSGRLKPARSRESHGRRALREHGIGEDVQTADLNEQTRVPDPRDVACGGIGASRDGSVRYGSWRNAARGETERAVS